MVGEMASDPPSNTCTARESTGTFTDTCAQRSPSRAKRYPRCLFPSSLVFLGS